MKMKKAGLEQAYQNKTVSKDKALSAVEQVEHFLDKLPEYSINSATWEAVGILQRYFAPVAPKKKAQKDSFEWVLLAVSKDDTRKVLHFAEVKDGFAVATDGRRLHKAPCDKPAGYYHPSGTYYTPEQFAQEAGTFPNWEQVVPDEEDMRPADFSNPQRVKGTDNHWSLSVPGSEWATVNEAFFNDATASGPGKWLEGLTDNQEDIQKPLVYRDGDRYALVMPIKAK